MHSPTTTFASFAVLLAVVGGAFAFVSASPVEIRKDPWFGFRGSPLSPELAQAAELDRQQGFLVMIVEDGSPADVAGLRGGDRIATVAGDEVYIGGDLIIEIDETPVSGVEQIQKVLAESEVGDSVELAIVRGSETRNITVVLGEDPR